MASIARIPSSKHNLRSFQLNSEQHIQMLTALVLQLVQCVVHLPEQLGKEEGDSKKVGVLVYSTLNSSVLEIGVPEKASKDFVLGGVHIVTTVYGGREDVPRFAFSLTPLANSSSWRDTILAYMVSPLPL